MTNLGDELLIRIREAVRQQGVAPSMQDTVIELVGRALITILNDPAFYTQLRPVLELQAENAVLRNTLATVQAQMHRMVAVSAPKRRPPAKKKAAAPKKPRVVKKAPSIRVKGSTAANRKAFKEGFGGR